VFEEVPRSVTRQREIKHHVLHVRRRKAPLTALFTLLRRMMVTLRNEEEKKKIGKSPFSLAARMRDLSTTMRESLTLVNHNAKSPSNVTRET
jgi:hypothetical protein